MEEKIRVLLVEDDIDFVFLIKKLIKKDKRLEFAGHAQSKALGIELAKELKPEIVLMDLNLSGNELDGIGAAKEIKLATGAKILLLTSFEQPEIIIDASKKAFASGYIYKSQCQTLTDTVYKTATSITPQELFIKELIINELTSAEQGVIKNMAAGAVSVSSFSTIANQKTSIFRKLGIRNTDELVRLIKYW
ncbi:MAG: response regulator [Oscillospiraceae bacterium]|nr:response regulator [Oscillospiraceae bacterium]